MAESGWTSVATEDDTLEKAEKVAEAVSAQSGLKVTRAAVLRFALKAKVEELERDPASMLRSATRKKASV